MGVYLSIVGVADRLYLGTYLWEDVAWRHSGTCLMAGFTSQLSCEVSAFIICLITLDRFLVLRFPFSRLRFSVCSAQCAAAVGWVIGLGLASVPLVSPWQFYSQTGICVPLPVTRKDFLGHSYAFGVMIVLNFVLFLLIATGQVVIYLSIEANRFLGLDSSQKYLDTRVARRLITIAMSHFLCWFPVGLLGLLATTGTAVSGEVNVAMAVFVLPLNSALNPFLYTLNMIQEKLQKKREGKLLAEILLADSGSQVE